MEDVSARQFANNGNSMFKAGQADMAVWLKIGGGGPADAHECRPLASHAADTRGGRYHCIRRRVAAFATSLSSCLFGAC